MYLIANRKMRVHAMTRFSHPKIAFILILFVAGIGLFVGWRDFWFLTDDAFIAFRYIDNSMRGYGYVWNPPPFQPVEGYTSFLWIVLLEIVWKSTGNAPPQSANVISLIFSYLTLCLSCLMLYKIHYPRAHQSLRIYFVALFVIFLLLNRSFLAWTSSGLETAMFDFLIILWLFLWNFGKLTLTRLTLSSFIAALLALTRPDGLLFCAATIVMASLAIFNKHDSGPKWKALFVTLTAMLIPCIHIFWRKHFYGEWLPNTYYAKVIDPWPKSGLIYTLSFMMEFCLWPVAALFFIALGRQIIKISPQPKDWVGHMAEHSIVIMSGLTLAAHAAYYVLIVGGDHFEYRPFNHLIPIIFFVIVWSLTRLNIRPLSSLTICGLCVFLTLPVPISHLFLSRQYQTREQTIEGHFPITPIWPKWFHWYTSLYDKSQDWLTSRFACTSHQEHKVFWKSLQSVFPPREVGIATTFDDLPILAVVNAGVSGWNLPHIYILDYLGLNDYVTARAPIPHNAERLMAHTRRPPGGYIESFSPNITIRDRKLIHTPRATRLTPEDIVLSEKKWREWVKTAKL